MYKKVFTFCDSVQGQPSCVRLFQYPNFGGVPSALASKSFYKAETADLQWNKKGASRHV